VRIAKAALLYFAAVYSAGFMLGTIRVILLEPRLGRTAAVICEAPFILTVMVFAARWTSSAVPLEAGRRGLLLMGLVALLLQQLADFALGTALRGITPAGQIAYFATRAGMVYATLLVAFLLMPALVGFRSRDAAGPGRSA